MSSVFSSKLVFLVDAQDNERFRVFGLSMSDNSNPVPSSVRESIQCSYSHYIGEKGFKARYGQRLMIAEIVKGLLPEEGAEPISVVEAGTGTGKTIAYLMAAIPVARHLNKKIVISTATVTLQEQLVSKDLPDLNQHSDFDVSYVLAKGRGRYLCLSKLDMLLANQDSLDINQALYEDEQALKLEPAMLDLYQNFGQRYASGDWDGDRDSWDTELAFEQWQPVTTDHRQCTNRRCSYFSSCCFFKAREGLDEADCVIANHDLVLSDLSLGGGAILPPPEETIYIFDEGHHLADKALQHFGARLRVRTTVQWLKQLPKTLARLQKEFNDHETVHRPVLAIVEAAATITPILGDLELMLEALADSEEQGLDASYRRFPDGVVPSALVEQMQILQRQYLRLVQQFDKLTELLKEAIGDQSLGISRELAERWFPTVGRMLTRAESGWGLCEDYAKAGSRQKMPFARWLEIHDVVDGIDYELATSPILAAETLRENLWEQCAGAVVTSATLTALGLFERLKMHTGLPANARYCQVPSPFDYARAARLNLPQLAADPGNNEGHDQAVIEHLTATLGQQSAALVLFTSWRQMLRVVEALRQDTQLPLLVQGEYAKGEMLDRHREAVDNGKGSILMGLASFAEGVDLPGKYLTDVYIAKIPFGVPGNPVESALQEWVREQGKDPFMEIAVPDASVRLVQACGRLIRTETDEGQVTILDNRMRTRRYGQALIKALPPFMRAT